MIDRTKSQDGSPTAKLRMLHLDLKTTYSYGDQLLFELVRQTFNGFAGGAAFELLDTMPFRGSFDAATIDEINEKYDGIVIGGGGLFPQRTNASPLSGWQWNCSVEMIERLKKPIMIFGVGNPPRYSPEKHNPVFKRHISEVLRRSAFCGLRSQGAADSLKEYLPPELAAKVTFQPCPTTIGGTLLPSYRYKSEQKEKKLALQFGLEQAHKDTGLLPEVIYPRLVNLIRRLRNEGWTVEFVGHKRSDMGFAHEHGSELGLVSHKFFGRIAVLFEGAKKYGEFPIVMGARGHSQMIPFGLEGIPLSFSTNDKIRYFAQHVNHPEWLVDPWSESLDETAYQAINTAYENQEDLRGDVRAAQAQFLRTTLDNLSGAYESITGTSIADSQKFIQPYTDDQLAAAVERYRESFKQRGEGM